MADDTTAQAPARGLRVVVLAGFVGFTLTFAVFHFILPARLWESSASESSVSLFLCAVVAVLTAAVAAFLLSRNLRLENQRMRSAINNMSQGLCMFDGNERLVVCNRRYMQMYGLSADIVTPGSTLHSLLEYRTRNGTFSRDPVAYRRELTDAMAAGNTRSTEVKSKDNRTIAVINRPMPGCGWVATHEDITGRRDAERERVSMQEQQERRALRKEVEGFLSRVAA
jgi:methyl-accepting chemotaxis protein